MRSLRFVVVLAPLLALLMQTLMPGRGETLPLFARKYNMPCSSCHIAFPRLNAFGMKFRQNGYRMEGAAGESPWEAGNFPLSLIGNVGYAFTSTDTADVATGAHGRRNESGWVQNAVEFHTAGTLAKQVTFHFDNGFAGPGGGLESGMAFVQFDDLGKAGSLNVKAGIYDAEIPYLSDSRKTTLHEYLSQVTLDGRGIELNGTKSGWTYAAGLINSDRDPANARPGGRTFNRLENVYAWLMRDMNGRLVTARVYMDRQDPRVADATTSRHVQAEVSAFLNSGRFMLIPGYTYERFDDQPSAAIQDKHQTGLIEALVLLDSQQRWVLTGRVELQDIARTSVTPIEDHKLGVLNLSYFVNPNAKVALEWAHSADNVAGPKLDELNAYVHVGY